LRCFAAADSPLSGRRLDMRPCADSPGSRPNLVVRSPPNTLPLSSRPASPPRGGGAEKSRRPGRAEADPRPPRRTPTVGRRRRPVKRPCHTAGVAPSPRTTAAGTTVRAVPGTDGANSNRAGAPARPRHDLGRRCRRRWACRPGRGVSRTDGTRGSRPGEPPGRPVHGAGPVPGRPGRLRQQKKREMKRSRKSLPRHATRAACRHDARYCTPTCEQATYRHRVTGFVQYHGNTERHP
jgi:hypothetical protein